MSETIVDGYLINKSDFNLFDEIITFISKDGRKYAAMSLGSRKIESSNGRNLFLGNLDSFEIFEARSRDKVSRLKKANVIEAVEWNLGMKVPFLLLNELIYKSEKTTKKHYDFYATYLKEIISEKESEDYIVMLMLRDYCKLSGLNLEVNKCVECSSNTLKTISFAKHGMLCNACAKKQKENYGLFFSKTIFYLFNDNSEELQKYKDEYRNVIKALTKYIENNSGLKIYSLNEY